VFSGRDVEGRKEGRKEGNLSTFSLIWLKIA
jgi:hypothetical protein